MKQKPSLREEGTYRWSRHWSSVVSSWVTAATLALALGGITVFVLSTTIQAADLKAGGDCCADLEERVAELEATTARKGNRKVSLTVYGQVNQAVVFFDPDIDGASSDITVTDNQNSESRFGFKGSARINKDLSAGYRLELGLDQRGDPSDPASTYEIDIRHSYWWVNSEQLGRLSVGHTSTSTDDLDSISTSNRVVVTKLLSAEPIGSSHLGGLELPFDGMRDGVVRYDTPTVGGFTLSAAWAGEGATGSEDWDAALRYAGEFGAIRVAAGIGYAQGGSIDLGLVGIAVDNDRFSASGSIKHTQSGLFLDGMYAQIEIDGVDVDVSAWHVLGGIEGKVNSLGATTFFGEYGQIEVDFGATGELDPSWYGLGLVQTVDGASMDFYLHYRKYDLGLNAPGVGDPQQVVAGARIRF